MKGPSLSDEEMISNYVTIKRKVASEVFVGCFGAKEVCCSLELLHFKAQYVLITR